MKGSEVIFAIMVSGQVSEYSTNQLIQLCALFDINESQLRTNLSRMSANNLIKVKRRGKNAYYMLADRGEAVKKNIARSFVSLDWSDWDKKWWGVSFSVPAVEKAERHYIRKKLMAYRFVSYNPGFWVRPLNRGEKLEQRLESVFANKHCRAIEFDFFDNITAEQISSLWKLGEINIEFERGLQIIYDSRVKIQHMSPADAYIERLLSGDSIVNILFKDPLLPEIYLPNDWAAQRLKSEFTLWDNQISKISKRYLENIDKGGT